MIVASSVDLGRFAGPFLDSRVPYLLPRIADAGGSGGKDGTISTPTITLALWTVISGVCLDHHDNIQ